MMNQGGKGANQAVAISRLGGDVIFVSKVGKDIFGINASNALKKEGISTKYLLTDENSHSGVALINVDDKGENNIVVAAGSNARLMPEDMGFLPEILEKSSFVLLQLEIPMKTVEFVAGEAALRKKKVILNPAPACNLSDDLLKNIFLITPNEHEAELISGISITDKKSAQNAALKIHEMGVESVVITLGKKGALIYSDGKFEEVKALPVTAVDTTAAGDVFNGALSVALSEGNNIFQSVCFANSASAISVTRQGAQPSIPYREEIN
jgi:ribokinase